MRDSEKFTYNFSRVSYPGYMEIACPHKSTNAYVYVKPGDWSNTLGRFVVAAISSDPDFKISREIWNQDSNLRERVATFYRATTHDNEEYRLFKHAEIDAVLELAAKILRRIHYAEPPASAKEKEFLKPAIDASRFLGPVKRVLNDFNLASFQPQPFEELPPMPKNYLPPMPI